MSLSDSFRSCCMPKKSDKYSWVGRVIFLSNLPDILKAQDILILTRQFGRVYRADVLRYPKGKSKGIAFVEFADADRARVAIEYLDNSTLLGRKLRCENADFPPDDLIDIYRNTAKQRMKADKAAFEEKQQLYDYSSYSYSSYSYSSYSDSDSGYSSYSSYSYSSYSYSSEPSEDEEEKRSRKRKSRKSKDKKSKKEESSDDENVEE